ncbi:MAG: Sec-independent protein translocase protein TatB [Desulfonatronovibrionaceae bacterium]
MFGIGSTELIVILVVALIVIGPAKLPEVAKTLGKAMGEFKRVSNDVRHTIETEMDHEEEKKETAKLKQDLAAEEDKKESSPGGEAETGSVDGQTNGKGNGHNV